MVIHHLEKPLFATLLEAVLSAGQSTTLGGANLSQLSGYGHKADNLAIGGASVSNVGNTSSLRLDQSSVNGYSSEFGTAQSANYPM